jgi:cellobiose PTS system EIIA component
MNELEMVETAMNIIAGAGDCKSYAMEAIHNAKEGKFKEAYECINESKKALGVIHEIQTNLIREEIIGKKQTELSLLMIHAQDHLMSSVTIKDLANEVIALYEIIHKKL